MNISTDSIHHHQSVFILDSGQINVGSVIGFVSEAKETAPNRNIQKRGKSNGGNISEGTTRNVFCLYEYFAGFLASNSG